MIYDVLHFNIFMILEDEAEAEDKWRVGRRALSGAGLGVPGPGGRDEIPGSFVSVSIALQISKWYKYDAKDFKWSKYLKFEIF